MINVSAAKVFLKLAFGYRETDYKLTQEVLFMKRRFYSSDMAELISEMAIPAYHPVKGYVHHEEHNTTIPGASGRLGNISLNGFMVGYADITQPDSIEIAIEQEGPHLELHFELEGEKRYINRLSGGRDIIIQGGNHALMFLPEMKGTLAFIPEQQTKREIGIEFTPDRFAALFDNDLEVLGAFGRKMQRSEPGQLEGSMQTTPLMKTLLHEIVNCELQGIVKKLYIESKLIEVVSLVIDQATTTKEPLVSIQTSDVEKLHYAKQIILDRLNEPCSLLQLSRMSGLNDFKLKKGFKQLFGTTVFGLLFDERMKLGKQLLLSGKHSVTEVAFMVGYKNPTHFTVAFKRKFGILPSQVRH